MRVLAVDVNAAAKMTSLSVKTLRLYIRTGVLRATKCGRRVIIPVEALEELAKSGAPKRTEIAAA